MACPTIQCFLYFLFSLLCISPLHCLGERERRRERHVFLLFFLFLLLLCCWGSNTKSRVYNKRLAQRPKVSVRVDMILWEVMFSFIQWLELINSMTSGEMVLLIRKILNWVTGVPTSRFVIYISQFWMFYILITIG